MTLCHLFILLKRKKGKSTLISNQIPPSLIPKINKGKKLKEAPHKDLPTPIKDNEKSMNSNCYTKIKKVKINSFFFNVAIAFIIPKDGIVREEKVVSFGEQRSSGLIKVYVNTTKLFCIKKKECTMVYKVK